MSSGLQAARAVLADVTRADQSTASQQDRLSALGLDSLDRVALAVRLEEVTGSAVPDEVLRGLQTVGDVGALLAGPTDSSPPPPALPVPRARAAEETPDRLALVHPTAEVEAGAAVGPGTRIWHQAQVREGARVGADCVLGKGVYVGPGSVVGDRVKIQVDCGVFGARVGDDALLAPGVYLLEDPAPRATNPDGTPKGPDDWERRPVTVRGGATIGANAVVGPGVVVGTYALVAIGSVVSHDVPDHAMVGGNPARQVGWVCRCGKPLGESLACRPCNHQYTVSDGGLTLPI